MKRVIEGKRYDTETATEIAEDSFGYYPGDGNFRAFSEKLYKTPRGRWFLWGEGGGLTRWAHTTSNGACGGEGIIVFTDEQALAWCEQAGVDADIIAEHFEVEDA